MKSCWFCWFKSHLYILYSFLPSFNKYLLSARDVPGTVLDIGYSWWTKETHRLFS